MSPTHILKQTISISVFGVIVLSCLGGYVLEFAFIDQFVKLNFI